jgi:hypothetical protein
VRSQNETATDGRTCPSRTTLSVKQAGVDRVSAPTITFREHHDIPDDGEPSKGKLVAYLDRAGGNVSELVIADGQGNNPVRVTGLVLLHLDHICNQTVRNRAQIWVLRGVQKPAESPTAYLAKIAHREKMTVEAVLARHAKDLPIKDPSKGGPPAQTNPRVRSYLRGYRSKVAPTLRDAETAFLLESLPCVRAVHTLNPPASEFDYIALVDRLGGAELAEAHYRLLRGFGREHATRVWFVRDDPSSLAAPATFASLLHGFTGSRRRPRRQGRPTSTSRWSARPLGERSRWNKHDGSTLDSLFEELSELEEVSARAPPASPLARLRRGPPSRQGCFGFVPTLAPRRPFLAASAAWRLTNLPRLDDGRV